MSPTKRRKIIDFGALSGRRPRRLLESPCPHEGRAPRGGHLEFACLARANMRPPAPETVVPPGIQIRIA